LSWTALTIAGTILAAAVIVFAILWAGLARANRNSEKLFDQRQTEFNNLLDFIDDFPTECDCNGTNFGLATTFPDDEFAVFYSGDPSNETQIVFDVTTFSSPSTNYTLYVRNISGIIAYLSDVPTYPTTFADDEFAVVHYLDNSKQVMFDCSLIVSGSTVVLTIQDASGTIAYLSDIVPQHTVFIDDVFAVQNAANPTKEVQLDASGLTSPSTVVMTVQDASGTIAYLEDLPSASGQFSETEFEVFHVSDSTRIVKLNVSALVTPGSTTTMTVQDKNGTIAYVDQRVSFDDYDITADRLFPDIANEGVETLAELGATRIEVWLCGGGGGSLEAFFSNLPPGITAGFLNAGGSGAGFDGFVIENTAQRFERFNCTIGAGGIFGTGMGSDPNVSDLDITNGGTTILEGIPLVLNSSMSELKLEGYGGTGSPGANYTSFYGGRGGSNGGPSQAFLDGDPGDLGGLAGSSGIGTPFPNPGTSVPGGFRYPWRAGSHGGSLASPQTTCNPDTSGGDIAIARCPPAPFIGGGSGGAPFNGTITGFDGENLEGGGGGGMFGPGGDSGSDAEPNTCAGGGMFGNGGSGRIYLRVWKI